MRVNKWVGVVLLTAGVLLLAACGGGGGGGGSGPETPADTTPNAFAFADQTNVPQSTPVTSAAVTITGIDAASPISVSGGAYSLGCTATYVTAAASVNPNQQVCVRHTSAASSDTNTDTILTVGGVSDTFTSTTGTTGPADTTPNAFTFSDQTNVALSAQITSAAVTITGIDAASPVSVSGGTYSIGCTATYVTAAATVNQGQQVCVRHTSAASNGTATNTILTVGGVSDTFTSTTSTTGAADTTPDTFIFTDQIDVALSTEVTSMPVTITGIDAPSPISVSGGAYSIGCNAIYVTQAATVNQGQQICVRHTSAATNSTTTNTTLTVGGVSDTFTSTTLSADTSIRLQRVFPALTFNKPIALEQAPGNASRWFVAEQDGVIRVFDNNDGATTSSVFLNISSRVVDGSGEKGLLGMAFDPAFASNHRVYVNYTRSIPTLTSYISRFTSADGGLTLDPASEVVLLTLPQPYENHNGGQLAFGPDGFLYVAFGDGGAGNDPQNHAQDATNLWGKILRISVGALPYTIPSGNPFAGSARCPAGTGAAACPEIFAWGLRNPWKFSFDRATGDLYAGDVGQGAWEEVDLIENGGNYGWRIREGAHCNIPSVGCQTAGLTDPVVDYDRSVGTTITGGYVYRGSAISGLVGSYIFGDFSSGSIFRLAEGRPPLEELLATRVLISSFAQDTAGELYVVSYGDGTILQIVPAGN